MEAWKIEAAKELADIQALLLQGYFEDKESLFNRLSQSIEALKLVTEENPSPQLYSAIALVLACSVLGRLTEKGQNGWIGELTQQAKLMFETMTAEEIEAFCQINLASAHAAQRQEGQ